MPLNINVIKDKILSENWFVLRNMTYELTRGDGSVVRHKREVYDRGNGATVLLYNRRKQSVVLVRQFRVATWVNGNEDGMLIETCAGLLDNDEPEACIRKEAIEETGYEVGEVRKLFELYMSPAASPSLSTSLSPNTAMPSAKTAAAGWMMRRLRSWRCHSARRLRWWPAARSATGKRLSSCSISTLRG
ncbi:GDP-mannose pyrophosphatase YffH [Raoultella terrigena]|uniref:GDP-mannose pyrophosphatase n=1 Tax=Raoultella terrigena TaxID=577 RepID=A0A7Z8Z9P0_RAOTE|nr:GDP-mannose pyrophosphatase YffH [Raoultella terrigena]